jgi:hypothetical protein
MDTDKKYIFRTIPDRTRPRPEKQAVWQNARSLLRIITVILLIAGSCKEPYFPEVDELRYTLITEALVTDRQGHSYVILSYYYPGTRDPWLAIQYARVHVKDDKGNIFEFRHDSFKPGRYIPLSSNFRAETGRSYTLHIDIPNEGQYESDPQEILPPARIDEIYARPVVRQAMIEDIRGRPQRTWMEGRDVLIGMSNENLDILRLRIEPELLLLYSWNEVKYPVANIHYRWKKIRPAFINDLNLHISGQESAGFRDHILCFLHDEKSKYMLSSEEHIQKYIMIIRYYTLNHEAYRFHTEAAEQLSNENRLFDPVPGRLPGNIICTSHPGRPVAGFFEASSVISKSFVMGDRNPDFSFAFDRIRDMEEVPSSGSWMNEKPPFWID